MSITELRTDDTFLKAINNKIVSFAEVVVCLFEDCNLSCVFCPQNHKSKTGASRKEIMDKVSIITSYLKSNPSNSFHIHIMGGELFQDKWIELGFLDIYQEFISKIKEELPKHKEIHLNFISNLVFQEKEQVLGFIRRNQLKISASYDPCGRFDENGRKQFEENFKYFKNDIRMVSCVLTKQNIEKVMSGDPTFDLIYANVDVDWDQLIPSLKNSPEILPPESLLLKFNCFLIDRYPRCINLENYLSKESVQKMRCTRGNNLTIMPDSSSPGGCSGTLYLKESKTAELSSDRIVQNFIMKYNCLSCEFYQRCPFTCFIKQDYKGLIEDTDTCIYKQTFEYAKAKSLCHG